MLHVTVGTDSWVTVAEADTYFSMKYGAGAWAGLSNDQKVQLLVSAHNWIQSQPDISIPETSTDTKVKQAQCEAAWYIYLHWENHDKRRALEAQGVKAFHVGNFGETLEIGQFPGWLKDLVSDFYSKGGQFPVTHRSLED